MKKRYKSKYSELINGIQGFIEMLDDKRLLNKIIWSCMGLMFLFELAPILNAFARLFGK